MPENNQWRLIAYLKVVHVSDLSRRFGCEGVQVVERSRASFLYMEVRGLNLAFTGFSEFFNVQLLHILLRRGMVYTI